MCDLDRTLRLCTCADNVPRPDWTLHRRDQRRPMLHRRGRAAAPFFTEDDAQLCRLLNENPRCFDFSYTPQPDDRLALRYTPQGWVLDVSSALDPWKTQLVHFRQGRVESA